MTFTPTSEQTAIIMHNTTQHARVLAGPGTGKSATIIKLLEQAKKVNRKGLLLTFTRAAANELSSKLASTGNISEKPSTMHSFSIAMLFKNSDKTGLPQPIRMADAWETKYLIHPHLKTLTGLGIATIKKIETEMSSNWNSLGNQQNILITDQDRKIYLKRWKQQRKVFGYSLLAELPYRFLKSLEKYPGIKIGNWNFLIVDEYQDLNSCELQILQKLSNKNLIVIGVGDDDQSIYSFREAHPIGIQDFLQDYTGSINYPLSISHRCGKQILQKSVQVINGLSNRTSRPNLKAANHCASGEIRYLEFDNNETEIGGISKLVYWLIHSRKISPEEIVVMYRSDPNNFWSKPLQESLQTLNIHVINRDEIKQMIATKQNRMIISISRLIDYKFDSLSWWSILNLTRNIGQTVIDKLYSVARQSKNTFAVQLLQEHELDYPDFKPQQRMLLKSTVSKVLSILEEIDIETALSSKVGWGHWLVDQQNLLGKGEDRFSELLYDLDDYIDMKHGLGYFLNHIQPLGEDIRSGTSTKSVRLMSMINSKGLTVKSAIIMGVEEHIVPFDKANLDEERRLLYVAMTRSTRHLFMTWAKKREGPKARTGSNKYIPNRHPSPFLTNILPHESGPSYLRSIGA